MIKKMSEWLKIVLDSNKVKNNGNGRIYCKDEDKAIWYKPPDDLKIRQFMSKILRKNACDAKVGDLEQLRREIKENLDFTDCRLANKLPTEILRTNNGKVNLKTGESSKDLSPEDYFLNILDFNYNSKAEMHHAPKTLNFFRWCLHEIKMV